MNPLLLLQALPLALELVREIKGVDKGEPRRRVKAKIRASAKEHAESEKRASPSKPRR